MVRLFLGLLKGAVVGVALGFGAYHIGLGDGLGYVVYGIIGFVVGLVVGRPVWSHLVDRSSTVWTAVLKGLFGFGVGCGLYALGHHVLGDPQLALVRLARRCRMTVLPGCGHLLPIEAGDAMRAELGVWLDQLGG